MVAGPRRRRALVVTAGLLAGPVIGCGDTVPADPAPVALADEVTVDLEFPRHLHAQRIFHVGISNHGQRVLEVGSIAIRSPLFHARAPGPERTMVEPTSRRTLPAPLGAAICPAPPGPSWVTIAVHETTAPSDGGTAASFQGLVTTDATALERFHRTECGQQLVAEAMTVQFASDWTVDGDAVVGALQVELRAAESPVEATIDGVRGTVLFDLRPLGPENGDDDVSALARLDGAGPEARIPVEFRVTRCDPHAVAESKKSFSFATWVTISDQDQVYVSVEPVGPLRLALEALIADCLAR